ncbi:acylphosphatase [Carboxydichorda subterranea]|uniref:acylphosphatase n=1 Tax=Carboxydichorda subterranea TaxID=3109565 RepID=UPI00385792AC
MTRVTGGSGAKAVRLQVFGRVQGVGFRDFTRREARRLGLVGWVRNLPDGSVEVWAEGPDSALEELVECVRKGPPGSRVIRVTQASEVASGRYPDFEVRRD